MNKKQDYKEQILLFLSFYNKQAFPLSTLMKRVTGISRKHFRECLKELVKEKYLETIKCQGRRYWMYSR